MPVNEGDCLFSFNQHTRFSLLQSAHLFHRLIVKKLGVAEAGL